MNDTAPEIARKVREMMMTRSGEERMRMASQMFDTARSIALASFPPGLDEIEIKRKLCQRFYGNEVNVNAFIHDLLRRREQLGS